MAIYIKRIYDEPSASDGLRVLVDRLWPRGVTKDRADLDAWMKDVAPTSLLRTWWNHDPDTFDEFARRYREELAASGAVQELRALCGKHRDVTLLYGAKDPQVNHAVVLRDYLVSR